MSSQLESIYSDELILLAETLGEVKTRTEKLEGEFSTHAKPLEAATNALSAALSGIKALQFHVLDNNLGALSARVEEMRKAVDEQVGVIALELKKADETNAAKAGADAEALRSEIVALQAQLGSLVTQFGQQLERVEFAAKEEAKKLQLIPGPAGAAGASLNPRGTFIDGETYNRLDVVSWLGSSYIAAVDGVTEKPSKNSNQWQTLASRGGGGAGGVGDFGSLAGVAQINQGGTGQTTRAAALNALLPDQAGSTQYMLLTDGSGTVSWGAQPVAGLPSQTSNSGRLLTTDGTNASWNNAINVSGGVVDLNNTSGSTIATFDPSEPTAGLTGAGRLFIGTGTDSDNSGVLVCRTHAGSQSGGSHGFRDSSTLAWSGPALWGHASFDSIPVVNTSGTANHAASFQSRIQVEGSVNIPNIQGFTFQTTHNGTGTINQNIGLFIDDALGTGTITTNVGLYINQLSRGATNNFSIYSSGTQQSYHAGLWQCGSLACDGAATVTGILTASTVRGTSTGGQLALGSGTNGGLTLSPKGNSSVEINLPAASSTSSLTNLFTVTGTGLKILALGATGSGTVIQAYNGNLTINPEGNNIITGSGTRLILQSGTAETPASAGASGVAGSFVWDASYIYVCTATNTWKRAALSTW